MRNEPVQIEIGTAKYPVGIQSGRKWESSDGKIAREYLTISEPGIRELSNAYIKIRGEGNINPHDHVVETDSGTVVWSHCDTITGAKRSAINEWFENVLAAD